MTLRSVLSLEFGLSVLVTVETRRTTPKRRAPSAVEDVSSPVLVYLFVYESRQVIGGRED